MIEKLAAPTTRIVSLTVTEGGYNIHPVTGEFDADEETMARDLLPGAAPTTVFRLVTEAPARRRERGQSALIVMSCDNVEGNGDVARRAFGAFARQCDPALADWVDAEVRFANLMVDRITPVTSDPDRHSLAEQFRVEDAWPVVCKPYSW